MFPYDNSRFPYSDIPYFNERELDSIIECFDEEIEYVTYFKGRTVQERLHRQESCLFGNQYNELGPPIMRWHPASELPEARLDRILDDFTSILELALRQRGHLFMEEHYEHEQARGRALLSPDIDRRSPSPCPSDDGIWPQDVEPFRAGLPSAYENFTTSIEREFHRAGVLFESIETISVIWAMQFLDEPVKFAWRRYQRDRVHTHTITWAECKTWLLQFADPMLETAKALSDLLASSQRPGQTFQAFATQLQTLNVISRHDIPEPVLAGYAWANALPDLREALAVQLASAALPRTVAELVGKAEVAERVLVAKRAQRSLVAEPGPSEDPRDD